VKPYQPKAQHPDHIIPPLLSYDRDQFWEWYQKYRPDAIMTGDLNIMEMLRSVSIAVPGDLGVACPLLTQVSLGSV